ncbi:MAG: hypothetical protein ABRQ25_05395 [Clostridiaceae bacterium]
MTYTTSERYIKDITLKTAIKESEGEVKFNIRVSEIVENLRIKLLDNDGELIWFSKGIRGSLKILNARVWNPESPYMYTFRAELYVDSKLTDVYEEKFGIKIAEGKKDILLI